MKDSERGEGMIGFKTALVLYGLLAAVSVFVLRGPARLVVMLVIGLLLVKTCLHYLRGRVE